MQNKPVQKGSTNVSVVLRFVDSSDGTPETGVDHSTTGLSLSYRREGETNTTITPAALTALNSAHTDGGVEQIGNGYVRVDVPDAAFATGSSGVLIHGTATGMICMGAYIQLVDYDPEDSTRLGLTALPNANADAAGGLPISDAGGLDLDTLDSNVSAILDDTGTSGVVVTGTPDVNVAQISGDAPAADNLEAMLDGTGGTTLTTAISGNVTGNLSGSVGSVTGAVGSVSGNVDGNVSGNVTGSVGSLATQAKADVNAECDTAISDAALATASALATVDANVDTMVSGILTGAVEAGTLSTTQCSTDLTGYADDQLIGRILIFTSGPCDGEATDITDYANTNGVLTFTALTTTPTAGNTFKIV